MEISIYQLCLSPSSSSHLVVNNFVSRCASGCDVFELIGAKGGILFAGNYRDDFISPKGLNINILSTLFQSESSH